jgi:hypothetical protein
MSTNAREHILLGNFHLIDEIEVRSYTCPYYNDGVSSSAVSGFLNLWNMSSLIFSAGSWGRPKGILKVEE